MLYHVTVGGRTFQVELGPDAVRVDGASVRADLAAVQGTEMRTLLLDADSYRLVTHRAGAGRWSFILGGRRYHAEAIDERTKTIREMTGAGAVPSGPRPVLAPMPGLVVRIEVAEGDRIEKGEGVVIVEAMKMENELKAESAGIVTHIHVTEGQTVDKDQILIELAAPNEGAEA
jgi:pyruvate carboxylase subunit B